MPNVYSARLSVVTPGFILLGVMTSHPLYTAWVVRNFCIQGVIFLLTAHVPCFFTKRMSYVDIAWPWGLMALGVQALLFTDGWYLRKYIIGSMYFAAGGRMGLGAVLMWMQGHLKKELPRYEFQRRRWAKIGATNEDISLQFEIFVQGLANASFLAVPAILQGFNQTPEVQPLEIVGYLLWAAALLFEHTADTQKLNFAVRCKKNGLKAQCCDVGLWRYSRHPNYFGEWMVWNSLILSTLPSLQVAQAAQSTVVFGSMVCGLLSISYFLYDCLTRYTGAIPAEFYSVQKRPDYKEYQQRVNMFFPGPRKRYRG